MGDIANKVNLCVKRAEANWGTAWSLLSARQRKAEVALEICSMLIANSDGDGPLAKAGCIAFRAFEELECETREESRSA